MANSQQNSLEVVICPACYRQTSLVVGTGKLMAASLPDPFDFTCPNCDATAKMSKSAVQTISISGGE